MPIRIYKKEQHSVKKKSARLVSYLCITVGMILLFWVSYPIVSYEVVTRLPLSQIRSPSVKSSAVVVSARPESDAYADNVRDVLQVSDWFPTSAADLTAVNTSMPVDKYSLSIPKLGIYEAKVNVGGEDLTNSLVHYLPHTQPGEYGSVNIFGHSTLPQLYNVKDYKTIFTHLPDLAKGDKIQVRVAGQDYEYEVYDMFVVKPEQVSVLTPRYDSSYLTLITCVPPGTYWNRLVVQAKLTHLPFQKQL